MNTVFHMKLEPDKLHWHKCSCWRIRGSGNLSKIWWNVHKYHTNLKTGWPPLQLGWKTASPSHLQPAIKSRLSQFSTWRSAGRSFFNAEYKFSEKYQRKGQKSEVFVIAQVLQRQIILRQKVKAMFIALVRTAKIMQLTRWSVFWCKCGWCRTGHRSCLNSSFYRQSNHIFRDVLWVPEGTRNQEIMFDSILA